MGWIIKKIILALLIQLIPVFAAAGAPLLLFTPLTTTHVQLSPGSTATVLYQVENQSSKAHQLTMQPINGITQVTAPGHCPKSFLLGPKQSCTLTLQIQGSEMTSTINRGPVVCQEKANGGPDPFLCYQPSRANSLDIIFVPLPQYRVIPSSGPNGTIDPSAPRKVSQGSNLLFTALPDVNYVAYQWFVDGALAQTGGISFLLSGITADHTIKVTFTNLGSFYSGGQDGNVYYSLGNGGSSWSATSAAPAGGSPVNSVFATANFLYAGTANGFIYYTADNGNSWNSTSQPDGSAINSVFVTTSTLYAGTDDGNVYLSSDNGGSWMAASQPDGSAVNSVFAAAGALYAGTAYGYVYYSIDNGSIWQPIKGQPDGSAVKNIFVMNNTLVVNTANQYVYSSSSLTGGGAWDLVAQSVYSLFAYAKNNSLYAGTQSGFVFAVTDGIQLGFTAHTPINSVFILD